MGVSCVGYLLLVVGSKERCVKSDWMWKLVMMVIGVEHCWSLVGGDEFCRMIADGRPQ